MTEADVVLRGPRSHWRWAESWEEGMGGAFHFTCMEGGKRDFSVYMGPHQVAPFNICNGSSRL